MLVRLIALNRYRGAIVGSSCLLAGLLAGCHGPNAFTKTDKPPDGKVVQAGNIQGAPEANFKGAADMATAEEAFQQENYKKAHKYFGRVADDTSNPPIQAEKARFFEGECSRLRGSYPDAVATFNRLLIDFQYGVYRERAVARMFEIANYWLDDTRAQIDAEKEKSEGKRTFVPWNFVHFDKTKPLLDLEGHALKTLVNVYYNDPTGPFAEKALFLAGYVHFHRRNFREADQLLTQVVKNSDINNKKSEYRDRALELAILAKNNASGGADYDGRKAAESLKLVQEAKMTSPELVSQRSEFLDNQLKMVRYMQAEKDFNIAEFYRRTGHPASAWFYYELVRRRYNGTEFHDKAVARMGELHGDLTEQQKQSEFAKATRVGFNKWVLGWDTPTLKEGQEVPTLPERPENAITPVGNRQPPSEIAPRR